MGILALGTTVLAVVLGNPPEQSSATEFHDNVNTGGPVLLFAALVLVLGIVIPAPLESLLADAAALLQDSPPP
jgi:hydrogenase-4 component F